MTEVRLQSYSAPANVVYQLAPSLLKHLQLKAELLNKNTSLYAFTITKLATMSKMSENFSTINLIDDRAVALRTNV